MNWAAGVIILVYEINSISVNIFLSGNIRQLTPVVYERMMNNFASQQIQIVSAVILYFFATRAAQSAQNILKDEA